MYTKKSIEKYVCLPKNLFEMYICIPKIYLKTYVYRKSNNYWKLIRY